MPDQSIDPRTGTPFGPILPETTDAEFEAVLAAADAAFPPWSSMSRAARARAITAAADALDAASDELVPLADRESGLGLPRLTGELARTTFQLRTFAAELEAGDYLGVVIDHVNSEPLPVGHPDLRRMLVPLGPVGVFGASNFPFAFSVAGGDTASALAAGCTVVVKAHPGHPQLSDAVGRILHDALVSAGAPDGVFGLVRGFDAGKNLVTDPRIKAVGFTGSQGAGRALFDLAVSRPEPIPFYGELGSVNPVFVTRQAASRPSLASDYLDSLLLGVGQFCTNPGVIVVPRDSDLADRIAADIAERNGGPMLNQSVRDLYLRHVDELTSKPGVRVIATGAPADPNGFAAGPTLAATTASEVFADPSIVTVECFGPAGLVVTYDTDDEARALASVFPGSLVACLHADDDEELALALLPILAARTGRVVWNGWPTGVAVTKAQQHGGPFPAATTSMHTSVGATAIRRFLRPVAFQSVPLALLPEELRD